MTHTVTAQWSEANPRHPAKYLATLAYRASNDAYGSILIKSLPQKAKPTGQKPVPHLPNGICAKAKAASTHFRGNINLSINWNAGSGITVTVP